MIKTSIIIPVYNNAYYTKKALADLSRLNSFYEVIVVDNGSQDNTSEVLEKAKKEFKDDRLQVISNKSNLGFGKANNIGYAVSRGDLVIFLNNDIRVEKDFEDWPVTSGIVSHCDDGELVAAQAGLLDRRANFVKEGVARVDSEKAYLSGWCLAGHKKVFEKLILNIKRDESGKIVEERADGPWNELFFAYFEDADLSKRAWEEEIKMEVIKDIPIYHFGRKTGKKINLTDMYRESQLVFRKEWDV